MTDQPFFDLALASRQCTAGALAATLMSAGAVDHLPLVSWAVDSHATVWITPRGSSAAEREAAFHAWQALLAAQRWGGRLEGPATRTFSDGEDLLSAVWTVGQVKVRVNARLIMDSEPGAKLAAAAADARRFVDKLSPADRAACGCPKTAVMVYHLAGICADADVARLGWYAGVAGAERAMAEHAARSAAAEPVPIAGHETGGPAAPVGWGPEMGG